MDYSSTEAASGPGGLGPDAVSIDQFVRCLADSKLLPAEEVQVLTVRAAGSTQDPRLFVQELVQQGKLTPYQAAMLCQGKSTGLVLGNYVLLEKLGQGGMGMVFQAKHRRLDRVVALKVLSADVTSNPAAVQRFQREVKAVARLSHPNIVAAHDADEAQGVHFFVMEYVPGTDLSRLVKERGPLPIDQAIDCIRQAAAGLAHAHAAGIVHRDIKPSNLLAASSGQWAVGSREASHRDHSTHAKQGIPTLPTAHCPLPTVKVLDLGLARVTDESGKPDELTSSGSIMGTADFMAPEQAVNTRRADHRADVYSLGCTLYYLLTGQVMYAGETAMEKLLAHREQPIPPLRALRPEVPAWLEVVYHCMVAKEPDGRYPSMNNVILALNRGAVPAARGRRRRWVAAAALVCVALGGTILAALLASSPRADNGPTRVAVEPTPIKKSNGAQQVAETIRQLKARNPRYSGEEKHTLDDQGRVRSLWLLTDEITDLSPVTALTDLRRLQLQGGGWNKGKVVDLKPLRGMQLADLSLNSNPVKDLTPLAGIPLVSLSLPNTNVSDLRPLAKMKLEFLDASHQPNITDLTPLTGMPLTKLFLWRTKVQDIGPLRGMPLRELNVAETQVRDLEPLRDCRQLVDLRCNFDPKRDEPFLRPLPKLQHINGMRVADLWKPD